MVNLTTVDNANILVSDNITNQITVENRDHDCIPYLQPWLYVNLKIVLIISN